MAASFQSTEPPTARIEFKEPFTPNNVDTWVKARKPSGKSHSLPRTLQLNSLKQRRRHSSTVAAYGSPIPKARTRQSLRSASDSRLAGVSYPDLNLSHENATIEGQQDTSRGVDNEMMEVEQYITTAGVYRREDKAGSESASLLQPSVECHGETEDAEISVSAEQDNEPQERNAAAQEVHQERNGVEAETISKYSNTLPSSTYLKIIKYLEEPIANPEDLGQIYIFKDPGQPHLIKIGRSSNLTERMKQVKKKCSLGILKSPWQSKFLPKALEKKIEKLIHYELEYFRRRFKCTACNVCHGEWFSIELKFAIQVTDRWINFVERRGAYTTDGALSQGWGSRMKRYLRDNHPTAEHDDHEARHSWWVGLGNLLAALNPEDASKGLDEASLKSTSLIQNLSLHAMVPRDHAHKSQEWQIWCTFQAVILFLGVSGLVAKYLFAANMAGVIICWLFGHLDAFSGFRLWMTGLIRSK